MPEKKEGGGTGILIVAGLGLLAAIIFIPRLAKAEKPPQEQPMEETAKAKITNVAYDIYSC